MKGGYESLSWINDDNGHEYVCSIDNSDGKRYEDLSEDERKRCSDVSQIVGTERW